MPLPQAKDERIFPTITPRLYRPNADEGESQTPEGRAARRLLGLARMSLKPWQAYLGWATDTASRAARLLRLHQKALDAESQGKFTRADFLWRQLRADFEAAAEDAEFWAALAGDLGYCPASSDPTELRRRLVDEVFIETHAAFYRGYARHDPDLKLDSRAFKHFDYLTTFLRWTGKSGASLSALLSPPALARLELLKEAGLWEHAFGLCRTMLNHFPDDFHYQARLADLHLSHALAALTNEATSSSANNDAETLLGAIREMEKLRARYPHNVAVYELLSHAHHVRAVKLANGDNLSKALLDAQKAVSYHPGHEQAAQTREKLVGMMRDLQEQMREVEEKMSRGRGASLNAKGEKLRREAANGFGLVNEYTQSGEPAATGAAYYAAHARTLWNDIGLGEPADRWDERAALLVEALGHAITSAVENASEPCDAWRRVADSHPDLAALDADAVVAFLRRRLASAGDDGAVAAPPAAQAAQLPVHSGRGRASGEPLGYWLFSRQHLGVKVRAACAALLLLLAGGLWLRESWARRARDHAYGRIVAAAGERRYAEMLKGAEDFLSHAALVGRDARREQVVDYYTEALVRFVVQQDGGELSSAASERLARYTELTGGKK